MTIMQPACPGDKLDDRLGIGIKVAHERAERGHHGRRAVRMWQSCVRLEPAPDSCGSEAGVFSVAMTILAGLTILMTYVRCPAAFTEC